MGKTLLIFVGSPGVGAYINAMANAVSKYDVDQIGLVKVIESPSGQQMDFENFANKTLWDVLCGLVEGVYKEPERGSNTYRETPVPEARNCEAYKKLKEKFGSSHILAKVTYPFLSRDIEKLKTMFGDDVIIDLSGVPKRVAIDILTACLAAGISDVMLFELEKPLGGVRALYHNLKEGDYKHVVLPQWEPLINNIKFFSARQNREKLRVVVISILAALILTIIYQIVQIRLGNGNWISWLLIIAIAVIGLVGGVTPIVDAWGGISVILASKPDKKHQNKSI